MAHFALEKNQITPSIIHNTVLQNPITLQTSGAKKNKEVGDKVKLLQLKRLVQFVLHCTANSSFYAKQKDEEGSKDLYSLA